MTLPSSGPLSLADIRGEFGGGTPISINSYYAGGGLVPPGTVGSAGPVPSSGTIDINVFHGTSKFVGYTHQYFTGSGNEPIPVGSVSVTIHVEGPGGPPGGSQTDFGSDQFASGGGGGSGGYSASSLPISPGNWGQTLSWVVGTPGSSNSTVSGPLIGGTIIGNRGGPGGSAASPTSAGGPGSGGANSSTGNAANAAGNNGGSGQQSTSSGLPGGVGGAATFGYGQGAQGLDAPPTTFYTPGGGSITFVFS